MKDKGPTYFVTKPSMPPLEEYVKLLEDIWTSRVVTNGGPYHKLLESSLEKYLHVKNLSLCSNGTIGLLLALKALDISGEVITTPYSFIATSHSLLWNGLRPKFVDIEPNGFNIDPLKVQEAITKDTVAILAVHCYGEPCNLELLDDIAKKNNLRLIYDAAHAFGVKYDNRSILSYGDMSVLSFHATKVFHTFEGGAIVANSESLKQKIDIQKNFGFKNEMEIEALGINGKMSEINAAFGTLALKYIDTSIAKRRMVDLAYRDELDGMKGIKMHTFPQNVTPNFSYFPIIIDNNFKKTRDQIYQSLAERNYFSRRYFYPLITNFSYYKKIISENLSNLKNANKMSESILCLPIYEDLPMEGVKAICNVIKG